MAKKRKRGGEGRFAERYEGVGVRKRREKEEKRKRKEEERKGGEKEEKRGRKEEGKREKSKTDKVEALERRYQRYWEAMDVEK